MILLGIYRSRKELNSDIGKEKITLQTTCLILDTEQQKRSNKIIGSVNSLKDYISIILLLL